MKLYRRCLFAGLAFAAVLGVCSGAEPETSKLELVRMDAQYQFTLQNYLFHARSSQSFFLNIQDGKVQQSTESNFSEAVKKEPVKLLSEHPLRGVAKLGSQKYGFVLDKKDEKSEDYSRLYFDLNGNGDLTDDKPIDAPEDVRRQSSSPMRYFSHQFPRADLTIDVDGQKLDYSFYFQCYINQGENSTNVNANLSAAAYRQGEITLDGKKKKIIVVDYNSNGRFDDLISLPEGNRGYEGSIYPQYGDELVFEPEAFSIANLNRSVDEQQQYLSKLNALGGKFYQIKVSPVGDEITFTPAEPAVGEIASPHAPCSVTLIGDEGYLTLNLEKSHPTAVPVGTWRVLGCDILVTEEEETKKEDAAETPEKEAGKPSLFSVLKKAIVSAAPTIPTPLVGPKESIVSARGNSTGTPVIVKADETTTLKIGPPYKLHVNVYNSPGQAQLMLEIRGSDGETVSNMLVKGERPDKPEFTITDPKGEVVAEGNFEYG
jgi:hypothetical protein